MRSRLIAVLAAVPLAITACGGSGGSSAPEVSAAAPDDRPVKNGGTLTVALNADPDALDPTTGTTLVGREVFVNMCEKLYDIDAKAALVPQLATALPELSADGKTATVKLRTGIKFNDGTALDAAAVKRSLDRHRTLETSARKADLAAVDEVTVVDPSTIRLTLSRPFAPLTAQLADRAGMVLSPAALDKGDEEFAANPVCVGPFEFVSRTSGSEIVLGRAADYYDAAKVKLDKLVYKIIIDPNVRAANLKSGDIQVGDQLATTTVAGVQADPNLRVVSGGGLGYQGITINIGNVNGSTEEAGRVSTALGGSPQLREAFELALDRNVINRAIFNGLHEVDCSPIPVESAFRSSTTCPKRDINRAKQLIAQSGVTPPIKVEMTTPNDTTNQRLAELIQQLTKEAGFEVSVKTAEFVTTLDQAAAGDFDTLLVGWSGRVDPDGNLSNIVTTGGANNYSGTADPAIDGAIEDAASTTDLAQRKQFYAQTVQALLQERGVIYLFHNKQYLGTRKDVAGIRYFQDSLPRFMTAGYAQ